MVKVTKSHHSLVQLISFKVNTFSVFYSFDHELCGITERKIYIFQRNYKVVCNKYLIDVFLTGHKTVILSYVRYHFIMKMYSKNKKCTDKSFN